MRKLVVVLLVLLAGVSWLRPRRSESVVSLVYPLSVSGKAWETDIDFGPGFKVKAGKVNDKTVGDVLRGIPVPPSTVLDFATDFLNLDQGGRFYLYFDGRNADGTTTWRVATNPNGVLTTTLNGVMTQDGIAFLSASYSPPLMGPIGSCFVNAKVKFAKGTFNPQKISGTCSCLLSSSPVIGEGFTVKFKTVGGPLA